MQCRCYKSALRVIVEAQGEAIQGLIGQIYEYNSIGALRYQVTSLATCTNF